MKVDQLNTVFPSTAIETRLDYEVMANCDNWGCQVLVEVTGIHFDDEHKRLVLETRRTGEVL